jgi:hypothetical protein
MRLSQQVGFSRYLNLGGFYKTEILWLACEDSISINHLSDATDAKIN